MAGANAAGDKKGREEGRKEARTDGREERRTDGRTEGRTEGRKDGKDGRMEDRKQSGRMTAATTRDDGDRSGKTQTRLYGCTTVVLGAAACHGAEQRATATGRR
jgi:flagellar biosynthesis/type III secretory pathway protein FliH